MDFKPKEKIQRKVVNVWKNMTLQDLANNMDVNCGECAVRVQNMIDP